MFNSQLLQSRIFTMIFLFDSVRSRIYLWIWMSLITLASSATTCSRLYFTAINGFHRIENIFLKWKKIQINVCNCTTSQHERLVLSHHQLMMQIMFFQKIIHCLWCFFRKAPQASWWSAARCCRVHTSCSQLILRDVSLLLYIQTRPFDCPDSSRLGFSKRSTKRVTLENLNNNLAQAIIPVVPNFKYWLISNF